MPTHITFSGRRNADKQNGLEVGAVADHDAEKIDIDDALTERLDDCGHMFRSDGVVGVRNHYPEQPNKEPRTSFVQFLRVDFGDHTDRVMSCTCEDFKYRRLPKSSEQVGDDEIPHDPFDVPPEDLAGVFWSVGTCKHIDAVRRAGVKPESNAPQRGIESFLESSSSVGKWRKVDHTNYVITDSRVFEPSELPDGWTVGKITNREIHIVRE